MHPTAALCRAQIAIHRERAANAQLDNVRQVAAAAEKAWLREAALAEHREARRAQSRAIADDMSSRKQNRARFDESCFSENPDRGHAGADDGGPTGRFMPAPGDEIDPMAQFGGG